MFVLVLKTYGVSPCITMSCPKNKANSLLAGAAVKLVSAGTLNTLCRLRSCGVGVQLPIQKYGRVRHSRRSRATSAASSHRPAAEQSSQFRRLFDARPQRAEEVRCGARLHYFSATTTTTKTSKGGPGRERVRDVVGGGPV